MALNLGATAVDALKVGSATVDKLMLGDVQVWPAAAKGWTPLQLGAKLKHWLDFSDASTVTLVDGKVAAIRDKGPAGYLLDGWQASTRHVYVADYNGSGLSFGRVDSAPNNFSEGPLMVVGGPANQQVDPNRRLRGACAFMFGEVASLSYNAYLSGTIGHTFRANNAQLWNTVTITELGGTPAARLNCVTADPNGLSHALALYELYDASGAANMIGDGYGGAGGGWQYRGDHCEAVFTDPLTDEERQKLEGYVLHRWNKPDLLPADHPYKAAPPA